MPKLIDLFPKILRGPGQSRAVPSHSHSPLLRQPLRPFSQELNNVHNFPAEIDLSSKKSFEKQQMMDHWRVARKSPAQQLIFACQHGALDMVRHLLQENGELLKKTDAIHHACRAGQFAIVAMLFEEFSVDLNQPSQGVVNYPLHEAVRANHPELVRYLIKHGASTDLKDTLGDTPLNTCQRLLASARIDLDYLPTFKILLEAGMDVAQEPIALLHEQQTEIVRYNEWREYALNKEMDGPLIWAENALEIFRSGRHLDPDPVIKHFALSHLASGPAIAIPADRWETPQQTLQRIEEAADRLPLMPKKNH